MRFRYATSAEHTTRKPKQADAVARLSGRIGGLPLRLFTLDEYHEMGRIGILTENDRCELIRGMVVEKPVINPQHKKAVRRAAKALADLLSDDLILDVQGPITLATSEPEPDLAISYGPDANYDVRHPGPGEIPLVIEVSDSTLDYDRGEKLQLYAQAKIPEYWIVNLDARCIEVRSMPRGGKTPVYRRTKTYGANQSISLVIDGRKLGSIRVVDILP